MNAIEFLNSDEAELSKIRDDNDFLNYLDKIFQTYISKMSELNSSDYLTQQIILNKPITIALCDRVKTAVQKHLQGFPHLAYNEIDLGIKEIQIHFNRLFSQDDISDHEPLNNLYRIRLGNSLGANFKKKDLFHIPFEERYKVTRHRYSIPGLPCLYLGSSLFVCWEEMGRPDFNSIYFSRYKPRKGAKIKVLNFGYRPALMAAFVDKKKGIFNLQSNCSNFVLAQVICWPIIAACSIKQMYAESPFIEEYIVPQLVLQWIMNNRVCDGIRYFSVRTNIYPKSPSMLCNYVFPSKQINATGYCPVLRDKFEMSDPISWQFIERTDLTQLDTIYSTDAIEIVPGVSVLYMETPFGKIEAKCLPIQCSGL